MKKISIIVPVYNVERYLRKCLDSCLCQDLSYDDYEVIVVNDGSPDNSWSIIQEYEKNFPNVKTINKENGGLSSARNAGLSIAEGELIWFVDSDDSIKENCLLLITSCFQDESIEVITINYNSLDEKERFLKRASRNLEGNSTYNGLELFEKGWIYPFSAVQFYVFRRQYLSQNGLRFKDGVVSEDVLFSIVSYTKLNKCLYLDAPLYNYYVRKGSITHSGVSYKKGHDYIEICRELHGVECVTPNQKKIIINKVIAHLFKSIYYQWAYNECDVAQKIRYECLKNTFWLKSISKSKEYKYIPLYFLFKSNFRVKLKRFFVNWN